MKNKSLNRSRRERQPYLPRPDFALTGIIAGSVGGMVISVIMEVSLGQPRQIIMLVTGVVGLALGASVEGIRYAWRVWRWKAAKKRMQENASKP